MYVCMYTHIYSAQVKYVPRKHVLKNLLQHICSKAPDQVPPEPIHAAAPHSIPRSAAVSAGTCLRPVEGAEPGRLRWFVMIHDG